MTSFARSSTRLGRLARFCYTRSRIVVVLLVLGLIAFRFVGQVIFGSAFANKFGSGNFESARAQRLLQQHFPAASGDSFFFSSRRRHTRSLRDWSSDVCSSD